MRSPDIEEELRLALFRETIVPAELLHETSVAVKSFREGRSGVSLFNTCDSKWSPGRNYTDGVYVTGGAGDEESIRRI